MLELIKELKRNMILVSIFYLAVGVVLVAFPQASGLFICYLIGGLAVFYGAVHVVVYLTQKMPYITYRYDLVKGIIGVTAGIYVLLVPEVLITTLPTVMGLVVVVDSIMKVQNGIDLKRMNYSRWWMVLIGALVTLVFGILMIYYPFTTYLSIITFVGLSLIVNGICDLLTIFILQKKIRDFKQEIDRSIIDETPKEEVIR